METDKTCFLSYAHEDAASAQRLNNDLVSAGALIWFDREALQPGERWIPAIRRGIRTSRYFLALLSSRSVSKKGFVQNEIREALDVLSEYPDDEIYLIPLRLDECIPTHDRLLELQWVDLFPHWDAGIARLIRFLGVAGAASPPPPTQPVPSDTASYVRLRFDGLYQSVQRHDYWRYLRFYDDGLVLSVSSTGPEPSKIARWFSRENKEKNSHGTYSLTGRQIMFAATSTSGTVDYEGTVEGDTMVLKSYSHINGNRGVTQYDFRVVAA